MRLPLRCLGTPIPLVAAAVVSILVLVYATSGSGVPVPDTPPLDGASNCPDASTPDAVPTAARFVDSVGVVTHLAYRDTAYGDLELVRSRLAELGVRHIRDGWPADDMRLNARARRLARDGVGVTFVHDPRDGGTPAEQHRLVRDNLGDVVVAAESLNERDTRPGDWVADAVDWTTGLSRAYRSDPRTRDIPLIAPSVSLLDQEDDHRALGELRGLLDYGNTHDYPGKDLMMDDRILGLVQRTTRHVVGDVPPVATETGYSDGQRGAPYEIMSPEAIAVLLPRLLLEHFRGGVERTFLYELLDEGPGDGFEESFGLVAHDGRPKPSFSSLQALLALLATGPQRCDQPPLVWSMEGADRTVRSLLLRGGEGTYYLALWRQVQVWQGGAPLVVQPLDVTLRVSNPLVQALAHQPHLQATATLPVQDGELTVPVAGAVTVVELVVQEAAR